MVAADGQVTHAPLAVGDETSDIQRLAYLPLESIVEAVSTRTACLAYRATTRFWTVTGHSTMRGTSSLVHFSKVWRVVRIGRAHM